MTILWRIKLTRYKWMSLSLVIHLLFLTTFISFTYTTQPLRKFGMDPAPPLSSYLADISRPVQKEQKALLQTLQQKSVPTQASSTHTSHLSEPAPALLAYLHAAIAHQQRYPASAEENEQTGRATVAFTLFPDGNIDHLKLVHSSGTQSLDNAAIIAVRDAVPFQMANRYLTNRHDYQVDVVFELG